LTPWSTFAQVAGTAAAALIGLLFVAVSIRIDFIARSQELRNRAAQTLSRFGTVLVTAILIAIPGQATQALGAELTALAVIAGGGLFVLDRRAKADASTQAIRKTLEMSTPTTIVSTLLLVSGVLLAFGVHAGLYLLILPVLVALTGGVASAWLFLCTPRSAGMPCAVTRYGPPARGKSPEGRESKLFSYSIVQAITTHVRATPRRWPGLSLLGTG
jgi:hypothetical protein